MIRTYASRDANDCADLYNRWLGTVPTFVPVDPESLHRAMTEPDSAHDELAEGTGLVMTEGREMRAWAAVCRRRPGPDAPWGAVLRALCVPHADVSAVAALVDAVREWSAGAPTVVGGSGGLRFHNGGDGALAESTGLAPALIARGLWLTTRELVLQGPVEPAMRAMGPASVEAADDAGSSRATVDGRVVGECWIDRASEFSAHPDAAAHAFVQWIGTEGEWRGRGIARQLWAFTCRRLHAGGVRRISLSTPCANFAAQAFYYRVGLRVVDQGLGLETR